MRVLSSLYLNSGIYLMCMLFLFPGTVRSAPYIPDNDETVVETLNLSWSTPALLEIRKLQQILATDAGNAQLAATISQKYIVLARQVDDPRYYGYAQATLKNWWDAETPPASILMMRATIRQHFHLFDQALSDLNKLVNIEPDNGQAWLTKAVIEQVTGSPDKAMKSCRALIRLADPIVTTTCLANTLSLLGHAEPAYNKLRKITQSSNTLSVNEKVWVKTSMAEIAQRLGFIQLAEDHFNSAFALDNNDSYLISSFADFLILNNKFKPALEILLNRTRNNAHLLRLILVQQALGLADYKKHTRLLLTRYEADAARGNSSHLRDQARLYLEVRKQPQQALSFAKMNWKKQKEPDDAMIYLKSAIAASSQTDISQIIDWIDKNKLQDVRLTNLQRRASM